MSMLKIIIITFGFALIAQSKASGGNSGYEGEMVKYKVGMREYGDGLGGYRGGLGAYGGGMEGFGGGMRRFGFGMERYGGGGNRQGFRWENSMPKPYNFVVQSADTGAMSHRRETADGNGNVKGSYGYNDNQGLYRQVEYTAGPQGLKASVKTSEPGTDSKPQSPADVDMISQTPPVGIQEKYNRYGDMGGEFGGALGYIGIANHGGMDAGFGGPFRIGGYNDMASHREMNRGFGETLRTGRYSSMVGYGGRDMRFGGDTGVQNYSGMAGNGGISRRSSGLFSGFAISQKGKSMH